MARGPRFKHDHAEVLRLRDAGWPHEKIAEHLGMSVGVSWSIVARHNREARRRMPYQLVIDRATGEIISSRGIDISGGVAHQHHAA